MKKGGGYVFLVKRKKKRDDLRRKGRAATEHIRDQVKRGVGNLTGVKEGAGSSPLGQKKVHWQKKVG